MARSIDSTTIPYDENSIESILTYAGKLNNHTLREMGVVNIDQAENPVHIKGYFGQYLEKSYFFIENNNRPEPDFIKVGIELKSTPMKQLNKDLVSKERLVLGIIDYMTLNELKFEGSFSKKNGNLLIIFYKWDSRKMFYDFDIIKIVHWTFPEEDLRIIKEDWNTIAKLIEEGRAHELSERLTTYLAACTKGVGHDSDNREQPYSDVKAKQRALSLKSSYVNRIFKNSVVEEYKGVFTDRTFKERSPKKYIIV